MNLRKATEKNNLVQIRQRTDQPRAEAGATRNPGNSRKPGYPLPRVWRFGRPGFNVRTL